MAECCVLLNKRRKRPLDRFEWAAHMCGSRNEAWTMLKLQRHGGDVAAAFTLQDPELMVNGAGHSALSVLAGAGVKCRFARLLLFSLSCFLVFDRKCFGS